MNRLMTMVGCTCVMLSCGQALGDVAWDTVVFRDDFDSSLEGRPDPNIWVVNHPDAADPSNWHQGRTHFPNPALWVPTGEFPRVENGVCIIEHHLYDPYDPGTWFLGGEIRTSRMFQADRPHRIEARVRWNPGTEGPYVAYPEGLLTSFFLYGYDGTKSDEIDFEFTSKLINDDTVFLNTYDESCQRPECACDSETEECDAPEGVEVTVPDGLVPTEWNTFVIYWYPHLRRVEWRWVNPDTRVEIELRTESEACWVPDEPMAVHFNFWAPGVGWPCAYDAALTPVGDEVDNEICAYEIDYVEVRMPAEGYPPQYVDEIVSELSGWCPCPPDEPSYYEPACRVLGPPNWAEYQGGDEWWGSPRSGGEFCFKFSQAVVIDGPGADLRFWQGGGGGGESARVRVSLNCVDFPDTPDWPLLNDDVHTDCDLASDGCYTDFDLADTEYRAIRCVQITDIDGHPINDPWDGPDIDAIEALNFTVLPAVPVTSDWGVAITTTILLSVGVLVIGRRFWAGA